MNRCEASAYYDLRTKPGIAVKVGGSTRFITDAVLDEMRHLPAWTPQKVRLLKTGTAPKRATQPRRRRDNQAAAPSRERDSEVLA
jgi:hypothetical protein